MRDALQNLLYARYPDLYRQKDLEALALAEAEGRPYEFFAVEKSDEHWLPSEPDLTSIPADDSRSFELSTLGQMIRGGVPADMPIQQLQGGGRYAAHGLLDKRRARELLLMDLASGLLNEMEFVIAAAFLDTKDIGVQHKARDNFYPGKYDDASRPTDWTTFEGGDDLSLTVRRIDGDLGISDGERLRHSSPLIWIDKKRGWVRTRRFYRFLKKDEDDEVS